MTKKPIRGRLSLHPLSPDEALRALLEVKRRDKKWRRVKKPLRRSA